MIKSKYVYACSGSIRKDKVYVIGTHPTKCYNENIINISYNITISVYNNYEIIDGEFIFDEEYINKQILTFMKNFNYEYGYLILVLNDIGHRVFYNPLFNVNK